jgi:hypothetical protein
MFYPGHSESVTVYYTNCRSNRTNYEAKNETPAAKVEFRFCKLTNLKIPAACDDRRVLSLPNGELAVIYYSRLKQDLQNAGLPYPKIAKGDIFNWKGFVDSLLGELYTEQIDSAEKKITALFALSHKLGCNLKLSTSAGLCSKLE